MSEGNKNNFQSSLVSGLLAPVWMLNRRQVIFSARSFHLVYFGVFASVSSIISMSLFYYYVISKGIVINYSLWVIFGLPIIMNLICAKLFHIFSVGFPKFKKNQLKYLNETSFYNQGGMLGIAVAMVVIYFLTGIPGFVIFDGTVYGCTLALFFGRLGCLNYGCCIGRPTENGLGVAYTSPDSKIARTFPDLIGIKLIPVQLYSALINFGIFLVMTISIHYFPYDGLIGLIFVFLYNLKRVIIQPYRIKESSNNFNYRLVAFLIMFFLSGIILLFIFSGEIFFLPDPSKFQFSVTNYFRYSLFSPGLAGPVIVCSTITFLAYGVHGKRLGSHISAVE